SVDLVRPPAHEHVAGIGLDLLPDRLRGRRDDNRQGAVAAMVEVGGPRVDQPLGRGHRHARTVTGSGVWGLATTAEGDGSLSVAEGANVTGGTTLRAWPRGHPRGPVRARARAGDVRLPVRRPVARRRAARAAAATTRRSPSGSRVPSRGSPPRCGWSSRTPSAASPATSAAAR